MDRGYTSTAGKSPWGWFRYAEYRGGSVILHVERWVFYELMVTWADQIVEAPLKPAFSKNCHVPAVTTTEEIVSFQLSPT